MIPLPPTDISCVYSTLKYIENLAANIGRTPVCTFDQALWWKALQVLQSPHALIGNFIIKLGGFHTIMSWLGCIGYVMAGSGLKEALECAYAEYTTVHMLNGGAVYRAIRGHQLVKLAFETLLLQSVATDT